MISPADAPALSPGAVYLGEGVRREDYCCAGALCRARVITAAMFFTVCASNPASHTRDVMNLRVLAVFDELALAI